MTPAGDNLIIRIISIARRTADSAHTYRACGYIDTSLKVKPSIPNPPKHHPSYHIGEKTRYNSNIIVANKVSICMQRVQK